MNFSETLFNDLVKEYEEQRLYIPYPIHPLYLQNEIKKNETEVKKNEVEENVEKESKIEHFFDLKNNQLIDIIIILLVFIIFLLIYFIHKVDVIFNFYKGIMMNNYCI